MKLILPATSANLGCGYDSLGLALRLYNTYEFWESDNDEVFGSDADPEQHLVFQAMREAQYAMAFPKKSATLKVTAEIPEKRGLGSSAACVAAGVMMAFLLQGKNIDKKQVLSIGTTVEGHPDNLAPILYGGFTASLKTDTAVYATGFPVHPSVEPLIVVPRFGFATDLARDALPDTVPITDAVANLARVGLLIGALEEGKLEELDVFTEDRLHEPYRMPLIAQIDPNYRRVREKMRSLVHGVSLSGAGPTLIGFCADPAVREDMKQWLADEQLDYDVLSIGIERDGYRLEL